MVWDNTAPKPMWLASVWTVNSCSKSEHVKSDGDKLKSNRIDDFFRKRSITGETTEEKLDTKRRYLQAIPTQRRTSETVLGVGISKIALTLSESTIRPRWLTTYPSYLSSSQTELTFVLNKSKISSTQPGQNLFKHENMLFVRWWNNNNVVKVHENVHF